MMSSAEKLISPHHPFLAWCEVCGFWKPDNFVTGRECRSCAERREFWAAYRAEKTAKERTP